MANNKDFIVKSDIETTNIIEGLGTVSAGTEGYHLTGASYDSVSFSVSGQDGDPYSLFFRSDGAKMYVAGDAGNDINEYNLSTPWTVSSASYSQNFSVASQESAPNGVFFKTDGTKMFVVGTATDTVYEYALSSAWDISSASYSSVSFSVGSQDTVPTDISFNTDGTKMFIVGNTGNSVYEYALSSAWVVSSASYTRSFSVASQTTGPQGLFFSSDGLNMVVAGGANVNKYVLSSAFDISSASHSQAFAVSSQEGDPQALFFKSDGTKMYVLGSSSDTVYQYSTVLAKSQLDLSTGSVFNFTPTSNTQVTLTNPAASGTVSQATLVYNSQDTAGISGNFSSTLYTGNGSTQSVTTGVDLSGSNGGLVWLKDRSATNNHALYDTARGATYGFEGSNSGSSSAQESNGLTAFTSTGFSLGNRSVTNNNNATYVAWTFKKKANFFDIVTYTGNGTAGRTIPHNLGTAPGFIIVKRTNGTDNWTCYHRGANGGSSPEDYTFYLNTDEAQVNQDLWADTAPTSSVFSLGDNVKVNGGASNNYIAYLFGHSDTGGPISCGHYTGNSNATGPVINVGFEPQFVMIKRADAAGPHWNVYDNARGVSTSGNDKQLEWNNNTAEADAQRLKFTATGFQLTVDTGQVNGPGSYIYMAIAAEGATTTTYNNTIDWPGGTAPTSPAIGETDVLTFSTSDGGATYKAVHAIDGAK